MIVKVIQIEAVENEVRDDARPYLLFCVYAFGYILALCIEAQAKRISD